MILILCVNPCKKESSDYVYSGKVPKSASGSSQNKAGSFLICFPSLGRPAWNPHTEEHHWQATLH